MTCALALIVDGRTIYFGRDAENNSDSALEIHFMLSRDTFNPITTISILMLLRTPGYFLLAPVNHAFISIITLHLSRLARSRATIRALPRRTIQILKFLQRNLAILKRTIEAFLSRWQNNGEIGIGSELDDEHREDLELDLQDDELLGRLRRAGEFARALLEVLDDIGEALESIGGGVLGANLAGPAAYYQE